MSLFNALIRTHHITSKKKVAKLKQAAALYDVLALLRSGGPPGIMYVEGGKDGVQGWVATVHKLRYKDYQPVAKPAALVREHDQHVEHPKDRGLSEIDTVKEFGQAMQDRGVYSWWRKAMGYAGPDI